MEAGDFAYEKLIHAHEEKAILHYRRLTAVVMGAGAVIFLSTQPQRAARLQFLQ